MKNRSNFVGCGYLHCLNVPLQSRTSSPPSSTHFANIFRKHNFRRTFIFCKEHVKHEVISLQIFCICTFSYLLFLFSTFSLFFSFSFLFLSVSLSLRLLWPRLVLLILAHLLPHYRFLFHSLFAILSLWSPLFFPLPLFVTLFSLNLSALFHLVFFISLNSFKWSLMAWITNAHLLCFIRTINNKKTNEISVFVINHLYT